MRVYPFFKAFDIYNNGLLDFCALNNGFMTFGIKGDELDIFNFILRFS